MSAGTVFSAGWTLDDIDWAKFDGSRVDATLVASMKGASLVEYNAPDYVAYLKRVFKDAGEETLTNIDRWGEEEVQHGLALGRWSEMADPTFDFKASFARFRAGYRPPHFESDSPNSIRGNRGPHRRRRIPPLSPLLRDPECAGRARSPAVAQADGGRRSGERIRR
jgi:hypothetical protein